MNKVTLPSVSLIETGVQENSTVLTSKEKTKALIIYNLYHGFEGVKAFAVTSDQSVRMRARSLTELELEAIADLDASIRGHDTFLFDGKKSQASSIVASPSLFHRVAKSDLSSSTPRTPPEWPGTANKENSSQGSLGKINAGYILYDGHEIQYISSSESQSSDVNPIKEASRQNDDSVRSCNSSLAPVSKQQLAYGSNDKDFISNDFLSQSGYSLSHMQRLPTYAHFSIRQKIYFFLIGMAVILSFNTFHLSLTYFSLPQLFGKTVLSSLGKLDE